MTGRVTLGLLLRHPFLRFALVGGAGYMVDTGMLAFDTSVLGLGFESGRALSIFTAMCCTWAGNRYLTFPDKRAHGAGPVAREWLRFVAANLLGALVNYGLSVLLVHTAPPPLNNKYAAQAMGVLAGLVFNFTLSRKLVFKGPL